MDPQFWDALFAAVQAHGGHLGVLIASYVGYQAIKAAWAAVGSMKRIEAGLDAGAAALKTSHDTIDSKIGALQTQVSLIPLEVLKLRSLSAPTVLGPARPPR